MKRALKLSVGLAVVLILVSLGVIAQSLRRGSPPASSREMTKTLEIERADQSVSGSVNQRASLPVTGGKAAVPSAQYMLQTSKPLQAPQQEALSRIIETVVQRRRELDQTAVFQALREKDDKERIKAFYDAVSSGVELPADSLRDLALQDGSPEVRFLALQALGVSPEVGSVARLALNDADSHVRTKAQEILLQLEDGTQAQPPDQSTQGQ